MEREVYRAVVFLLFSLLMSCQKLGVIITSLFQDLWQKHLEKYAGKDLCQHFVTIQAVTCQVLGQSFV